MARLKQDSTIRLTDEEMQDVKEYIVNLKLQQRALVYADISYAKFKNILHDGRGMTRHQHSRLIEFCNSTKASKLDS